MRCSHIGNPVSTATQCRNMIYSQIDHNTFKEMLICNGPNTQLKKWINRLPEFDDEAFCRRGLVHQELDAFLRVPYAFDTQVCKTIEHKFNNCNQPCCFGAAANGKRVPSTTSMESFFQTNHFLVWTHTASQTSAKNTMYKYFIRIVE